MAWKFKLSTPNPWCVLSLLVVLGWVLPVQAQSEPALRFTSPTVLHVSPANRLLPRNAEPSSVGRQEGIKWRIFSVLSAQQADAASLTFAVEGQSGDSYEYCASATNCGPVQVRVKEDTGGLILGGDLDLPTSSNGVVRRGPLRQMQSRFEDFPPQRVEVSVQSGQQKVYQEVRVTAPADVPDCRDYPELNEDRYRCYFTRETGREAFKVANSPLVAELPGQLVQDRGEYELVFAEEFNGSYQPYNTYADNCDRGLAELDQRKWNYRLKLCRSDPQTEPKPCEYLADGSLHISVTGQCGTTITARGLVEPKYGYVEIRYTVGTRAPPDRPNYNVVIGGGSSRAHAHLLRSHNLNLDSLERLLTLVPYVEIDFFEYLAQSREVISHQYRNWAYPAYSQHESVRPMLTYKLRYYCSGSLCRDPGRLTITEGMEWTPGGYLFLRRIHGRDDVLKIIPNDFFSATRVYESSGRHSDGNWRIGFGNHRSLVYDTSGGAIEQSKQYFVQLDPNDDAFYLEAVGISHAPSSISTGGWNQTANEDRPLTNESELTIDYIRVFQPRNRYADMEPLHQ